MLVLTRKVGESIVIDGGIVVSIQSVGRYSVRLGIEADRSVKVVRSELLHDQPAATTCEEQANG